MQLVVNCSSGPLNISRKEMARVRDNIAMGNGSVSTVRGDGSGCGSKNVALSPRMDMLWYG